LPKRLTDMLRRSFGSSLALHLLALGAFIFGEVATFRNTKFQSPVGALEVSTLTDAQLGTLIQKHKERLNPNAEKIIVQSDDRIKNNKKAEDYLSAEKIYLSKSDNVVDRNTRAAKVDKFKNVLKQGSEEGAEKGDNAVTQNSPSSEANEVNEVANHQNTSAPSNSEITNLFKLAPQLKDLEQQARLSSKTGHTRGPASIKGEGESATDDYLEGVAVGVNTLLNTKEFVFYSFYERIREKLSHTWRTQLSHEMDQVFANGRTLGFDRKTKIQIELDPRGQLKNVKLLGSSGVNELDRAAINAFKMAAPFPNPPKGMVDDTGSFVAIKWDFVVLADAGAPTVKMEVRRSPAGF